MTINITRCQAKSLPCAAGERCPEHRGYALALDRAAQALDFESFVLLGNAMSQRGLDLQGSVKQNRVGEFVVALQSRTGKRKINVGRVSRFEQVSKDRALPFDAFHMDQANEVLRGIYGPDVSIKAEDRGVNLISIDSLTLPEAAEPHGVRRHILESYLLKSREDLYSFGLAEDVADAATLRELGFARNPYYWLSRVSPAQQRYPNPLELEQLRQDRSHTRPGLELVRQDLETGYRLRQYAHVRTLNQTSHLDQVDLRRIDGIALHRISALRAEALADAKLRGERQQQLRGLLG